MTKAAVKKTMEQLHWRVKPLWNQRDQMASKLQLPDLVTQLLYNRGVSELEQAKKFLQPSLKDLIEPQHFTGIDNAVERINQALKTGEKIVLYGDYDVDGITGVAILWHCLKLNGVDVEYYVPHRIEQGYGLNPESIRQLAEKGTKLIITVDCGVSAHQCADLTADLGVDLIITDHHNVEDDLPQAVAIVHPDLPGGEYPNKSLCGAGVAFKLAWALAQKFSGASKVTREFRDFLVSATGLAALGTIADVVPLQGENRILARFGLEGLAVSADTGIKALIAAAGLTGEKLDSFDVGFKLAPRLNAAGRMGHARLAVELFTRAGKERAKEIAQYLESQNRQRQKVEKNITADAIAQVTDLKMDNPNWRGIVAAGDQWHGGVIGIVASRIVDKFHRPTVVISLQDDKALGS
ncbi:MAG: single-stranded-DNA-specific exonuclease RecJ, partial [Planctomycetes bacterium]|nr:single-stranded-DNA-specific exonuclease RecJ [Planctomycetota bacterium]